MAIQRVDYLQNLGAVYGAEETRRFLKLLANRRAGVNVSGDLAVTQNGTPNLSVNIAAGEALVNGSETVTQGAYYLYNDAVLNRTIAASDPTNPRNDLVCLRVRDQVYSGTNNDGDVVVVTGTPAGSPVDPAAPANSLTLARVVVGAGVTSIVNANITDLRTWQSDRLIPGLSGFVLRNAADSQSNLNVSDAGIVTLRNALSIPPSAGGTLAPTSYGTLPLKFDEKTPSGVATTSFTLPSGFTHAQFRGQARSDAAVASVTLYLQFNTDTAADYVTQQLYGTGNVASSTQPTGATATPGIALVAAATGLPNSGSTFVVDVTNYSGATFIKEAIGVWQEWGESGANYFMGTRAVRWNVTTALTSILFGLSAGSYVSGSKISGYVFP